MNMPSPAAAPLLEVRNLATWFPVRRGLLARTVGYVRAVDDVSLTLAAGETMGLVGESGCGKTTLGRTLLGLEPAHGGEIIFDGENLSAQPGARRQSLRRRMQMIFQDPYSSLNPRLTVLDLVTEGLVAHNLIKPRQKKEEAVRLLREVGLDADALYRYPHEFSGGQRQRICIARALSLRPELVVCDEAVSALDISIRAQVLNLLLDLRARRHLAYLFISHDLSVVRYISERVAVMYMGRIVEIGPCETILAQPAHPYTRALIAAAPEPLKPRRPRMVLTGDVPSQANPPPGCRFHTRCPFALELCRQSPPPLEPLARGPAGHCAACFRKDESME